MRTTFPIPDPYHHLDSTHFSCQTTSKRSIPPFGPQYQVHIIIWALVFHQAFPTPNPYHHLDVTLSICHVSMPTSDSSHHLDLNTRSVPSCGPCLPFFGRHFPLPTHSTIRSAPSPHVKLPTRGPLHHLDSDARSTPSCGHWSVPTVWRHRCARNPPRAPLCRPPGCKGGSSRKVRELSW